MILFIAKSTILLFIVLRVLSFEGIQPDPNFLGGSRLDAGCSEYNGPSIFFFCFRFGFFLLSSSKSILIFIEFFKIGCSYFF